MKLIQDKDIAAAIETRIKNPEAEDPVKDEGTRLILDTDNPGTANWVDGGYWWKSGEDQFAEGSVKAPWWRKNSETLVLAKPFHKLTQQGEPEPNISYEPPQYWIYLNLTFKVSGKNVTVRRVVSNHAMDTRAYSLAPSFYSPAEKLSVGAAVYAQQKEFDCGFTFPVFSIFENLAVNFKVTPVPYSPSYVPDGLPPFPK